MTNLEYQKELRLKAIQGLAALVLIERKGKDVKFKDKQNPRV